jgi:hypothetical protein
MMQHKVQNIMHLENDVMIFHDFTDFQWHNPNKILITLDAFNRCVPGIMFFPNGDMLKNAFDMFDHTKSDMCNWALCYHKLNIIVDTLPIFVNKTSTWSCNEKWDYTLITDYYSFYEKLFDAAAIGQYLGGIDPRNNPNNDPKYGPGYVSEDCIINYSPYHFIWKADKEGDPKKLYMKIEDKEKQVYNLHVHCKNLRQFIQ